MIIAGPSSGDCLANARAICCRAKPGEINTNRGEVMPYGGNDWLALTEEATLEPEIPICDPHHHFWDFRSERVPYQRYLLHELVADVGAGHNVRSTVFIEARAMYRPDGPEGLRPVGEVEFVQGLAAASASGVYGPCRAAAGIVGRADLKLGDRGEPQPVSRYPPYGHLGPASRGGKPGKGGGARHRRIPCRRACAGADGAVARHRIVLPAIARARGLRQSSARSDDRP